MAWSIMFLLLPLTCVYYPGRVLPDWLQAIAWTLPPTYVFEGLRALLVDQVFRADLMLQALAINIVFFALRFSPFWHFCAAPAGSAPCWRAANSGTRCGSAYAIYRG